MIEGRGLKAHWRSPWRQFEDVVFHKLDIADLDSVTEFAKWLKQTYNGLDILGIPITYLYISISLWNCCWCGNIREFLETSSGPPCTVHILLYSVRTHQQIHVAMARLKTLQYSNRFRPYIWHSCVLLEHQWLWNNLFHRVDFPYVRQICCRCAY